MADTQPLATTDGAERLFRLLLKKVGLSHVSCLACARALLPAPFNWESFTYTAATGQSWTWDIDCARGFSRDRALSDRLLLEPVDLAAVLKKQNSVDEDHLQHIPADKLEEPVLLAPVPDGRAMPSSTDRIVRRSGCERVFPYTPFCSPQSRACSRSRLHRWRCSMSPPCFDVGGFCRWI